MFYADFLPSEPAPVIKDLLHPYIDGARVEKDTEFPRRVLCGVLTITRPPGTGKTRNGAVWLLACALQMQRCNAAAQSLAATGNLVSVCTRLWRRRRWTSS